MASHREALIRALWPEALTGWQRIWTVLDAARDDGIYSAVNRTYQEKCCLYAGTLPWQLEMAAPYLVQLDKDDDRFTNYVLDNGWGRSWGIFLRSEASIETLRRHLRGFLRVKDEAGKFLVFRYYDPRVLRVYLPTCRADELRTVFGPIDTYLLEAPDGSGMIEYRFDGRQLSERSVELQG